MAWKNRVKHSQVLVKRVKFSGPKKKGRKEEERKIAKLIVAKEDAKKGQFSTQQSK